MIVEQSFKYLPEILVGNRYPHQEYESGIVVAFTLATLQELNGRNINNPLSCIQAERLYRNRGTFPRLNQTRFLRVDLCINTSSLMVSNRFLEQYGWRHINWIEAKFRKNETLRNTKDSGNKTTYSAQTLSDLIRLSILVFEKPGTKSFSSRYLLHVYDSPPERYLAFRKRAWLKKLVTPGVQNIEINRLKSEAKTFKRNLGNINDLKLNLQIYNQEILPIQVQHQPIYWCFLTRIDSIHAEIDHGTSFELNLSREVNESKYGAFKDIIGYVATNLHLSPKDEKTDPNTEENDEQDDS